MSDLIGAGAAAAPDLIKDGTIETFEADVLNASMKTPVIVDFWAEWCGPCKQLGPLLEKAVKAAKGKVRLVKIDVDKNQMLAAQMRVQSIPTVYAFFEGRPVDGFQGAVPESTLNQFIGRLTDLTSGVLAAGADDIEAADAAFNAGDLAAAAEIYGRLAEADDSDVRALAGLARCHVALRDFETARSILDSIPPAKQSDAMVTSVRAALELSASEADAGDVAELAAKVARNPDDLAARFDLAVAFISAGDMEAAVEELLTLVEKDRQWNEEAARCKLVTIFNALGGGHPLTMRARRRLSSILFS
jgi:putative thioredoxin